MLVLARNYCIVNYSRKTAEVQPFSPEHKSLVEVPIVNSVMQCDDPYLGETCMLVCKEALHIPAMKHNLIPPFLIRDDSLTVDDLPKM